MTAIVVDDEPLMLRAMSRAVSASPDMEAVTEFSACADVLTIRCFGTFEAYAHGKTLPFRRSKTKELLAFLVDCKGASVTGREISAKLWTDDCNEARCRNYLRQLFVDLRHTLDVVGAGDVLVQCGYSYALDPKHVDCDYYRFLETGHPEFPGGIHESVSLGG